MVFKLKSLFLAIFDPHSSIVKSVFDCPLSSVMTHSHIVGFFFPWLKCLVSNALYHVDISHFISTLFEPWHVISNNKAI